MNRARSLPEYIESFQNLHYRESKVMIVTVDGDPDENPDIQTPLIVQMNIFVSIILMHILFPQMHPEEVPLTAWRDECLTLGKN